MLERLNKNQFKLQLRGREEDNEHVRLSDFVKELNSIKEVLVDIDKKISGTKNPTTDYKITDLSHSSPSTIAIEAIPLESNIDNSNEIVGSFFYGFQKIQKGTAPDNFDSLILEKYKKIAGGFKRKISEVVLYYEDSSFQIGRDFERQILEIIGEDEIFDGFVEGALEMINFHKGLNKFNIYPVLGPEKVVCHFTRELLPDAIKAVGEYIRVEGKLKYKKRDKFPYAIEVIEVIIYPKEKDLPTLGSLRGIAPNTLGGLSSEDFVRKQRNAK